MVMLNFVGGYMLVWTRNKAILTMRVLSNLLMYMVDSLLLDFFKASIAVFLNNRF